MTSEVHRDPLGERLSKDPSPTLVRYVFGPRTRQSLEVAFEPQMQIHLAHCLMLMERDIIPREDGIAVLRALLELYERGPDAIHPNYALEGLYSHIEHELISQLGPDIAGRLHTARSRNDLGVTEWRMIQRQRLLDVRSSLSRLRSVVLNKAESYADMVMPGYTHSQHAQPITLGYYLAAFADVLARDARRLDSAYATTNCNPLGAAALTTTAFPIDREATTRRLGFADLVENGFDAVASRDDSEEATCALSILGVHLARVAEDFFVWHTAEFDFIEFGDEYCNVSSIMPQKKNPAPLEFIKMKAGHLIGCSMQALAAGKGSWFTDSHDGSSGGNDPMLEATEMAVACLELLAGSLDTMEVRLDRMLHQARIGFGTMTEVTDTIVRESGVSFRVAHNIVGKTVTKAVAEQKLADEISVEMLDATSRELFDRPLGVSAESIAGALDPTENIRRRTVRGGPAPQELGRMLVDRRRKLTEDETRLYGDQSAIASATRDLLEEARSIARNS
jgi:argininosuccinate lyase